MKQSENRKRICYIPLLLSTFRRVIDCPHWLLSHLRKQSVSTKRLPIPFLSRQEQVELSLKFVICPLLSFKLKYVTPNTFSTKDRIIAVIAA